MQSNNCSVPCLACAEFGLWLGVSSGAFGLSHHVRTRERRTSVNYVHEASSTVADGIDVWPDNVSIDIVLISTLAAVGLVGCGTGQLL